VGEKKNLADQLTNARAGEKVALRKLFLKKGGIWKRNQTTASSFSLGAGGQVRGRTNSKRLWERQVPRGDLPVRGQKLIHQKKVKKKGKSKKQALKKEGGRGKHKGGQYPHSAHKVFTSKEH